MNAQQVLGLGLCRGLVAPSPLAAEEPKLWITLTGHRDRVYSVAYSPDGKTLASGSWDQTIKLWVMETGK